MTEAATPGEPLVRLGFVLASSRNRPLPSTRIAALNMFEGLRQSGFDPHVCFEPETPCETPELKLSATALRSQGIRCVVFQKCYGAHAVALARRLAELEIATIFQVCDVVDEEMCAATDATVVVSEFLRALYPTPLRHKVHVVHDGIEDGNVQRAQLRRSRGDFAHPLRGVLVTASSLTHVPELGLPPHWLRLSIVGRYRSPSTNGTFGALLGAVRLLAGPEAAGPPLTERLAFALSGRIRRIPWTAQDVREELQRADLALVPSEVDNRLQPPRRPVPTWLVRSENRLTLAMSAALPVVATPIPAYAAVIEHGRNGFLAQGRAQWLDALRKLRDPDCRRDIGNAARASVLDRFSLERQTARFVDVVRQVISDQPSDFSRTKPQGHLQGY